MIFNIVKDFPWSKKIVIVAIKTDIFHGNEEKENNLTTGNSNSKKKKNGWVFFILFSSEIDCKNNTNICHNSEVGRHSQ